MPGKNPGNHLSYRIIISSGYRAADSFIVPCVKKMVMICRESLTLWEFAVIRHVLPLNSDDILQIDCDLHLFVIILLWNVTVFCTRHSWACERAVSK